MEEKENIKFKEIYDRFFNPKNTSRLLYSWAGSKGQVFFLKILNKKQYEKRKDIVRRSRKKYYEANSK